MEIAGESVSARAEVRNESSAVSADDMDIYDTSDACEDSIFSNLHDCGQALRSLAHAAAGAQTSDSFKRLCRSMCQLATVKRIMQVSS